MNFIPFDMILSIKITDIINSDYVRTCIIKYSKI
jgi:hypothetical protein